MQPTGQFAIVLSPQLLQADETNPGHSVLGHSGDQRKLVYNLLSPTFQLCFGQAQLLNLCLFSSFCLEHPLTSPLS